MMHPEPCARARPERAPRSGPGARCTPPPRSSAADRAANKPLSSCDATRALQTGPESRPLLGPGHAVQRSPVRRARRAWASRLPTPRQSTGLHARLTLVHGSSHGIRSLGRNLPRSTKSAKFGASKKLDGPARARDVCRNGVPTSSVPARGNPTPTPSQSPASRLFWGNLARYVAALLGVAGGAAAFAVVSFVGQSR